MRRTLVIACLVGLTVDLWSSASLASSHAKNKQTSSPNAPSIGVLPVISCTTTYGAPATGTPFVAHQLASIVGVHGVSYYSNGQITLLGPAGWACSALVAADGGQALAVYPPGKPDYTEVPIPKGAQVIQVLDDYTGHIPGADLVCGFFPQSAASSYLSSGGQPCSTQPSGQETSTLTPDVVTFSDAAGVTGSAAGSGGALRSVGAVVYPQLSYGATDSVNVAMLSCTLQAKQANLCRAIEGDFLVRHPPVYVPQSTG